MKQNYWKSISITFLISIAFALFGCQKGAIDGQSEETSTSNTDAQVHHVAQESLVDNDGKIQVVDQLTATLGGIVVDELGMPVAGATVSALGNSVDTNIGGSWRLSDVPVTQVITQAALEGVSNTNGSLADDNQAVTTIAVSVIKDGYSSAVVSVATSAIVTESNASIDGDTGNAGGTAGAETSNSQPNTLVLTGLVGTSGDVVLKSNNSTVTGYLRNHENGNPVAGVALTLVPDRTAAGTTGTLNDAVIGNLGGAVGTVTYGYKNLTTTTNEDGSFTFSMVTAATNYELVINSANYLADVDPANDAAGELPGDAGAGNEDLDVGGDDGAADNAGGAPGQNPAAAGNVNADLALNGAGNGWMLLVTNQVTNSLGNLWVSKIESTDNVNPYITWVDNAFELTWNDTDDDFVQLDDTVDMVNTPVVIYFSEAMNATRVNDQFAGQAPEYSETGGGKAVPILVYQRDIDADGQAIACAATPTAAPNPACKDIRFLVDDEKTKLEGNKLTLYLKSTPYKDLHYVDVLLKQTDFIDMYGNHLVDVTDNRANIVPDLAAAMAKVDGVVADDRQDGIVDPLSYRNYWQVRFKLYADPDLSIPKPVDPVDPAEAPADPLERPFLRQVTCTDIVPVNDANDIKDPQLTVQSDDDVVAVNMLIEKGEATPAGLCNYGVGGENDIVQKNADSLPVQKGIDDKSRLTVLAQTIGDIVPGKESLENDVVIPDITIIELTGKVIAGAKYKVAVAGSAPELIHGDVLANQLALVILNGSQEDADGNGYYQTMVDDADQSKGFYFIGAGDAAEDGFVKGQQLQFKGLKVEDIITITPICKAECELDDDGAIKEEAVEETVIATAKGKIAVDDLVPAMVAIQSENYNSLLTQPGEPDTVEASPGAGELPGEILLAPVGGGVDSESYYPSLLLTASLYDRTTRRASESVMNDVPLLAFSDGKTGAPSTLVYARKTDKAIANINKECSDSHDCEAINSLITDVLQDEYTSRTEFNTDIESLTGINKALVRKHLTATRDVHSDYVYSRQNYLDWQDRTKEENKSQFADDDREVIIEMTEKMEGNLTYCADDNDDPDDENDSRCDEIAEVAGALDAFINANIYNEDDDVNDPGQELIGLRSYDENGSAYLLAKLDNWRNVPNRTLMKIKGLRDANRNEVITDEPGVIFMDRTPPLAEEAVISKDGENWNVSIDFDQNIKPVQGQTLLLSDSTGDITYTVTFISVEELEDEVTFQGTISCNIAYEDFQAIGGRSIDANEAIALVDDNDELLSTIVVTDKNLSFKIPSKWPLTDTTPIAKEDLAQVRLGSYLSYLDGTPQISWPGIADDVRDENRWGVITELANNPSSTNAQKNDAYYCDSNGSCKDPAIIATDNTGIKLAYSSQNGYECSDAIDTGDETGAGAVVKDVSCTRFDINEDGDVEDSEDKKIFANILHSNIGVPPNPYKEVTASTAADFGIWSYNDAGGEVNEPYSLEITFREPIACDKTAKDETKCTATIASINNAAYVDNDTNTADVIDIGISASGKKVTLTFERKAGEDVFVGDTISINNLTDSAGNNEFDMTLSLRGEDGGVSVTPISLVTPN